MYIQKIDVINVAKEKDIENLTEEQIDYVLRNFKWCCDADPTATWDLVVDDLIDKAVDGYWADEWEDDDEDGGNEGFPDEEFEDE
jgi:hypothetical protein